MYVPVCARACISVCVFVCEREKERERVCLLDAIGCYVYNKNERRKTNGEDPTGH